MHIWFIMDWNRRWATSKGILKMLWHTKWGDNVENIVELSLNAWLEYVSLWALAKKNIEERSKEELEHLYWLVKIKIPELLPKLIEKWVKFRTIWNLSLIPNEIRTILEQAEIDTKNWNKMTFIFAIWYWWQDEIIRWIKKYINSNLEEIKSNPGVLLDKLNEAEFLQYIDTWDFPAPDLIVRTWWDKRTSWYFLYLSEYSEFYFTDVYWPDFDETEFNRALNSLKNAKRNFWK